jgi:hypothetical protein
MGLSVINLVMGLFQPPPPPNLNNSTDRDLLIRLGVQMEHLRRGFVTMAWLVGFLLAGLIPITIGFVIYGGILLFLVRELAP